MAHKLVLLAILQISCASLTPDNISNKYFLNKSSTPFPDDFIFGVSTAAYQIEGGWLEDGKGMSVWDYATHTDPGIIEDRTNADVAADSYHLYKTDVRLLQELGVRYYKFSIAWTRILPNGLQTHVNLKGIQYYNDLINELKAKGIEPIVGMFHWDIPQHLQEKGGILNEDFPKWFSDYARLLYQHFGDRVKHWVPINEPLIQCQYVYELSLLAPRISMPGRGIYDCNRNLLLAHAKAYHIYDDEFRQEQKGNVSISVYADYAVPQTSSADDVGAANDYLEFRIGLFADPILSKTGNYPQRVIDRVASMSNQQGLNSSRLKPLTEDQIKYIRGTTDYVTVNHYRTEVVYRNATVLEKKYDTPSYYQDGNFGNYRPSQWLRTNATDLLIYDYAPGFYSMLRYIRDKYDNPEIYILENGFYTAADGHLEDVRISCIRNYLQAVKNAIDDGVRVKGYFFWTLMDSLEWVKGYIIRHGLYAVDIDDPARPRTPRKSALVFKEIVRSKVIDYNYNPSLPKSKSSGTSISYSVVSVVILVIYNFLL